MYDVGRTLLVLGLVLAAVGGVMMLRLPGDITIEGERFTFSFPIVTCLVVSAVATIVLNLLFRR